MKSRLIIECEDGVRRDKNKKRVWYKKIESKKEYIFKEEKKQVLCSAETRAADVLEIEKEEK